MYFSRDDYDAIVVGARCAGAATAMLLAQGGARVLLVDRDAAGSDTMSTHALMRGAVMQLSRWGLLDRVLASGAPLIRRTEFHYGDEVIAVDVPPTHGTPGLVAPRRYVLDAILVDAARQSGAEVHHRVSFSDVLRGPSGRVAGAVLETADGRRHAVRARLVIGADGRMSAVARCVRAATERFEPRTSATLFAYVTGIEDRGYRWVYTPGHGSGAIPTNDGASCVFVGTSPARLRTLVRHQGPERAFRTLLRDVAPVLAGEVAAGALVDAPRLFRGGAGHMRTSHGPGWALVGDAGYFKDPATAHGITDALRDAEALSHAILSGHPDALRSYQSDRDAMSAELFEITGEIAAMDWSMGALKSAHRRLNHHMKSEQAWMLTRFDDAALAA